MSSIVLFGGEIAIIQVFDEDICSLAMAKTVKIMCSCQNLLTTLPWHLSFEEGHGHFQFKLQSNCPLFPSNILDRQRSGQLFFDILILFCGDDLFSRELSPEGLPNIWLTGEHSEPIGTIRALAYGKTQKSPPSVQAVFQVVPPQSPRGFSALARLYYFARQKTAMLRRLRVLQTSKDFGVLYSVNHLIGPLRTHMFTCSSSKGHGLWFVIGGHGFRSVLFVSCFKVRCFVIFLFRAIID